MRDLKHRYLGCFGSFTWAGQAVRRLDAFADKVKYEVVASSVEMKQGFCSDIKEKCINLAVAMADRLKSDRI